MPSMTTSISLVDVSDGNAVFYQATPPPTEERNLYDVWFDTSADNKMYHWDGTQWTAKQFGTQAIADSTVTAALIAADAVTADKIVAGAVTTAKIAAGAVTANEIAANAVTAAKIDVSELSAISANLGTITGGTLRLGVSGDSEVTKLNSDGTGHIGAWNFDATKLYNGTYGSDGSLYLSTASMASKAIGGRTGADWRLTVGSKFGVTDTGAVYCGDIHANGGTLGAFEIDPPGYPGLHAPCVDITTQASGPELTVHASDMTALSHVAPEGIGVNRTPRGGYDLVTLGMLSAEDRNSDGYYGGEVLLIREVAGSSGTGHEDSIRLDGETGNGLFIGGVYEGSIAAANKYVTQSGLNTAIRYLNYVTFSSSSPAVIPNVTGALNSYKAWLLLGFAQNIGSVMLALTYSGSTLTARNLMTGTAFSNAALTFSVSNGALTIRSNATGGSVLLVITT